MFDKTKPSPKGTTAHPIKLKIKVNRGASKKIPVFAAVGKIVSLANNFLEPYFGITETMTNLSGVGTAGLSTAVGFTTIKAMTQ